MAQQTVNIGSAPNDGTGDTLRDGGTKINANFTELYNRALDDLPDVDAYEPADGDILVWDASAGAWINTPNSGGGSAPEASASEILIGSETGKYISPDKFRTATAPATLTSSTNSTAVDFEAGRNFTLTLGENSTLENPTNVQAGDSGTIYVIQDATGSRTLAYGSNWKHIGSAPTIDGTASVVNVFSYFARTTTAISLTYLGVEV